MTKQELIQVWRDYEAQANAAFTSEPFDAVMAFDNMMSAEIETTPASIAGRLLVQHGDGATKFRFEDRVANGLSIADDEVYRLLAEVVTTTAEILILDDENNIDEDIPANMMHVSAHHPGANHPVCRVGLCKRGDFAAAHELITAYGGIGRVRLQMEWWGGKDNAFTPDEQRAFLHAFRDMETVIYAG